MKRRYFLLIALLLPLLAACASGARGTDGGGDISLQVENDLIPATSLSVYAIPEIGTRRLVGIVRPNQTATLSFSDGPGGQYRFVGETTAGREIVSNQITLRPGDAAVWDVSTNVVVPM